MTGTSTAGTRLDRVHELRERAVRTTAAGRPAEAVRFLDTALRSVRRLDDDAQRRDAEAWVLISRADPVLELKGLQPALEQIDQALAVSRGGVLITALAHSQRAMLFGRSGDLSRAEQELRLAIDQRAVLPAHNQWVLLINRAMLHMERAELDEARADLMEARRVAIRAELAVPAFMATHNLGYVEFLAGDLSGALDLMRKAETETDGVPEDLQQVLLADEARVLMECGLLSEADELLARAAVLAERGRVGQRLAEIITDRARLAVMRADLTNARVLAADAMARFARRGAYARRDEAELFLVEADLRRGPRRAAARAERVLARQGDERSEVARVAALLAAEARLRAGELDRAAKLFQSARPVGRSQALAGRLHTDVVRAQLADGFGRPATARSILRRAATELAMAQARMSTIELRSAIAVHGRRLAEFDLDLAVRTGRARALLDASERWRAVSGRLAPVVIDADPESASMITRLRSLRAELTTAPEAQRANVRARVAQTEEELRKRSWALSGAGAGAVTGTADISASFEALQALSSDLISYTVHQDRLLAVCRSAAAGTLRAHDLGPVEPIRDFAARVRADLRAVTGSVPNAAIRSAIAASLRDGLAALDAAMLAPLELRSQRLVVVPARELVSLPWAMMPSRAGLPTTVAQSLLTWTHRSVGATGLQSSQRPSDRDVSGSVASSPAGSGVFASAGPGLDNADAEVRAVGRIWRMRPDAGWQARSVGATRSSTAGLAEALRTARVVHVAAHGRHNAQSPLFSSVRMGDGELFAHELQHTGVRSEHVVLSACDVGEATIRPGEEALGLTASLLALGARCVVAPVIAIPDDVAREVMTAYHRELSRGVDVAQALAVASARHELGAAFCAFGGEWRAVPAADGRS